MKKTLQIANAIALAITIFINYYASAGLLNGTTVGEISAKYEAVFTPASYAFSIWGLIYLLLTGFVIYQGRDLFKSIKNDDFVLKIGWWFVLSCFANCAWIVAWVYDFTGLSVLLITLLLISLVKIVLNTNMERWDAPFPKIILLWWPFCIYAGWVTVAVIANISAWLTKIGWNGLGLADATWAIIMILAAGSINLLMIWSRNMREFALVGIWALIAIAMANSVEYPSVCWVSVATALTLLIAISIHGYQNRKTAPYIKWKQMRPAE